MLPIIRATVRKVGNGLAISVTVKSNLGIASSPSVALTYDKATTEDIARKQITQLVSFLVPTPPPPSKASRV